MEATKKALDPRGLFNVVQRAALSPRPETLAGKTVSLRFVMREADLYSMKFEE